MMKQVTGIQESVQAERGEPCLSVISADRSVAVIWKKDREESGSTRAVPEFLQTGLQQTPGLKGEGVWG